MTSHLIKILIPTLSFILIIACNPFAPELDKDEYEGTFSGNQKTIEGVFQKWRYAYNFKDTLIYGQLIHPNFIFEYMDYEQQIQKTWNRESDLRSTNNLFKNSSYINLTWNEDMIEYGDSLSKEALRSFNLQISFPNSITRLYGRANISLQRISTDEDWQIIRWVDQSNY